MSTELATTEPQPLDTREQAGVTALAHVLGTGDLAQLSNEERVGHYIRVCRSLALNPLSRPFDWIFFKDPDGSEKLALYPNQSCAAQLRRQHQIRIACTRRETVGEMFVVEVKATTPDGREDFATKYVPLTNRYGRLTGQQYANALMKAETGAKRRVTLSMVGLAVPGDPDETPGWRPVIVDGTGMIIRHPSPEQRYLAEHPEAARAIGEPVFEDAQVEEDPVAVSQAVRPEEVAPPPKRTGPRPSFRPSDEDVKRWLGAWFAAVKGLSLEPDEERHRFVRQWTATAGWPEGKQTDSLRTAFGRMTADEAADFLAHVRAACEAERDALLEHAREAAMNAEEPPVDEEPF